MFSGCTWASTCMRRHPPIMSGARPGARQDAGYVRDRATGTWGTFCWTATGWPSVCARVRLRQRHTHFEREGKKCRRTRHVRQNVCPHPIVTGSASMLRQTAHSSRLGSTERGEADGAGAHAAVPAWVPMGGCGGGCAAMNRTPTQAVDGTGGSGPAPEKFRRTTSRAAVHRRAHTQWLGQLPRTRRRARGQTPTVALRVHEHRRPTSCAR
jgi:hypothetical protein